MVPRGSPRIRAKSCKHVDGSIKGECHVALFDILGFRQHTHNTPLDDLVTEFGKDSSHQVAQRWSASTAALPVVDSGLRPSDCLSLRFSDTILLVSPDASERGLVSILNAARTFLLTSIVVGVPVRGAVTRGKMFVSADERTVLGEAVVRAYDLEQSQAWIGAVVDDEKIQSNDLVSMSAQVAWKASTIDYLAPWKKGPLRERPCLAWPRAMDSIEPKDLRGLFKGFPCLEWGAEQKMREFERFYVYVRKAMNSAEKTLAL